MTALLTTRGLAGAGRRPAHFTETKGVPATLSSRRPRKVGPRQGNSRHMFLESTLRLRPEFGSALPARCGLRRACWCCHLPGRALLCRTAGASRWKPGFNDLRLQSVPQASLRSGRHGLASHGDLTCAALGTAGFLHGLKQLSSGEGLLEHAPAPIGLGQARCAVACGENIRQIRAFRAHRRPDRPDRRRY